MCDADVGAAAAAWAGVPYEVRRRKVADFLDALHGSEASRFARLVADELDLPLADAEHQIRVRLSRAVGLFALAPPADFRRDGVAVVARPLGVVGVATGADEALLSFATHACRAVAAGNAVVVSPATPSVAAALALLARHVPDRVATRARSAAAAASDPAIAKVFTDDAAVFAAFPEKTVLAPSGHHCAVVLPDADLDDAAAAVFGACRALKFQARDAVKRVFVSRRDLDACVAALERRLAAYAPASLPSDAQLARLRTLRTDALARGARLAHGRPPPPNTPREFTPLLVVDAPRDALVATATARWAGPLVAVFAYDDAADAAKCVAGAARVSVYGPAGEGERFALGVRAATVCCGDHFRAADADPGLSPYVEETTVHGAFAAPGGASRRRPPIPACVVVIPVLIGLLWVGGFSQLMRPLAVDRGFPAFGPPGHRAPRRDHRARMPFGRR